MLMDTERPIAAKETEAVLGGTEDLEVLLSVEVERLSGVRAPSRSRPEGCCYRGRPLWWWRFKLMSWAHSAERGANGREVLRGLRIVLRDWDESLFLSFLGDLVPPCGNATSGRGRSA